MGARRLRRHPGLALLALVILFSTARPAAASVECQYHCIEEYPLPIAFECLEIGPDDVVYGWFWRTLWMSADRGQSWQVVRSFSGAVSCRGIFVSRAGALFLGVSREGRLWMGIPGDPWEWTTPLVFHCSACENPSENSRMWKMCEDESGALYLGEYGGAWQDTCAYIHRSLDGGDTWAVVYAGSSRHVHFVDVDPYSGRIYASLGDGPGRHMLISSSNGGDDWDVLYSDDCLAQPVSIAFTPSHRVYGSDCGSSTLNRIYVTADDHLFETRLLLSGSADAYVWDMSTDHSGSIFAGTVAKLSGGSRVRLYSSYDGGMSWCGLKDFGLLPEWCGISDITKSDSEGWAYYCGGTAPGQSFAFRFRDKPASSVPDTGATGAGSISLEVRPTPSGSGMSVIFELPHTSAAVSLRVFDLSGTCVRTLAEGQTRGGRQTAWWDGLSDTGARLPSGVYFLRLDVEGSVTQAKAVVVR